jgi:RNA polymerase sigma factor (TIGR02999 family)
MGRLLAALLKESDNRCQNGSSIESTEGGGMDAPSGDVSRLLVEWSNGDAEAAEALLPLVYDELHRLARRYLRRERPDHTLQPTALVNEAYLRLVDMNVRWKDRRHFYGFAAVAMRRILVEHARSRLAARRGGGARRLPLEEVVLVGGELDSELVALDEALSELAKVEPSGVRLVELRYFAGLTVEEAAEVTELSPATVKRKLDLAKAWLHRKIGA